MMNSQNKQYLIHCLLAVLPRTISSHLFALTTPVSLNLSFCLRMCMTTGLVLFICLKLLLLERTRDCLLPGMKGGTIYSFAVLSPRAPATASTFTTIIFPKCYIWKEQGALATSAGRFPPFCGTLISSDLLPPCGSQRLGDTLFVLPFVITSASLHCFCSPHSLFLPNRKHICGCMCICVCVSVYVSVCVWVPVWVNFLAHTSMNKHNPCTPSLCCSYFSYIEANSIKWKKDFCPPKYICFCMFCPSIVLSPTTGCNGTPTMTLYSSSWWI